MIPAFTLLAAIVSAAGAVSIVLTLRKQSMSLENLRREVEESRTVTASAVAAFRGILQELRDAIAANDPAQLQQLADQLDAQQQELAAAITRNTPSEGEQQT